MLRFAGALFVAILLVTWLSPEMPDTDFSPNTYNSGVLGAKALFLVLPELGYKVERWEAGSDGLARVDPGRTTLVLAEPEVPETQMDEVKRAVAEFLERGGRVLVTGAAGAYLLPGGAVKKGGGLYHGLCLTRPEGGGALGDAGSVAMPAAWAWAGPAGQTRVAARCGGDAVVVAYTVGRGEAVWWASALPLTNRGLKEDASLKLALASLGGPERRVLFDESFHGTVGSVWDTTKGLPMQAIGLQTAMVAVLLVLSFGRRNGPVLEPVRVIRSSPVEFAESMGHLYQKAGATAVGTEGARRRVMRFLGERCGVSAGLLRGSAEGIDEALRERFGGDWTRLGEHLKQAARAEHQSLAPKSALKLVKALDEDLRQLSERVMGRRTRESE